MDYKNKNRAERIENEIERMSKLMDLPETVITESSLSRVWRQTEEFDIAILSAFRNKNVNCLNIRDNEKDEQEFTKKENLERNKDLLSVLLDKGYGVTKISGNYVENFDTPESVEVSEQSLFVINKNSDENFFPMIIKLGKYFCQDSVLLKGKGKEAVLYGTNRSDFPGLDGTFGLGKFIGGKEAEFMSRVGKSKRPFYFAEDYSVNSRYIISTRAKKVLSEL
jgi:hypothetical protein